MSEAATEGASGTRDPMSALREDVARYTAKVAAAAEPTCRICKGRGWTSGYIAPSKTARYECPCTGYGYVAPPSPPAPSVPG